MESFGGRLVELGQERTKITPCSSMRRRCRSEDLGISGGCERVALAAATEGLLLRVRTCTSTGSWAISPAISNASPGMKMLITIFWRHRTGFYRPEAHRVLANVAARWRRTTGSWFGTIW
jgi:hypothetical protein